jgi:hypothetical protein
MNNSWNMWFHLWGVKGTTLEGTNEMHFITITSITHFIIFNCIIAVI